MDPDINAKIKEQFGREAAKYINTQVHGNPTDLEFILQFIQPQTSWSVLDVATGGGNLAVTLSPQVTTVLATDLTEQMLEQVQKQVNEKNLSNVETKIEDVHELTFADESFDLVCSRLAPHHFHDINKAISELARVTKKDGFVFIQDTLIPSNKEAGTFFNKIEKMRDPSHVRALPVEEWISVLEGAGLKIMKQNKKEKIWPFLWWTGRMSTPQDVVDEIITLIKDNEEKFKDEIHIEKDKKEIFLIKPLNGYFLAQKQ